MLEIKNLSAVVGGWCSCICVIDKGSLKAYVSPLGNKLDEEHCQIFCQNYVSGHNYRLTKTYCISG